MSNMNFLIAEVIYFLSDTNIVFSQENATKIKSKQFSEFDSVSGPIIDSCILLETCHINMTIDLIIYLEYACSIDRQSQLWI